jgi:hypothetical protein
MAENYLDPTQMLTHIGGLMAHRALRAQLPPKISREGVCDLIEGQGPEGRRLNIAQPGRAGESKDDPERRRCGTLPNLLLGAKCF